MSYEKQTWVYRDEISAEKLNHMEEGISSAQGGGTLVARATLDTTTNKLTLDKTFKEISDAYFAGQVVKVIEPYDTSVGVWDVLEPNTRRRTLDLYRMRANLENVQIKLGSSYSAESEDSYPSSSSGTVV